MKTFRVLVALLLVLGVAGFASAQGIVERQINPITLNLLQGGLEGRNTTGGTIAANSLVYVSSYSTLDKWLITKADADAAPPANFAVGIVKDTCLTNYNCRVYSELELTAVNTNGSTVGNPVYLSATAGSWTLTAPTAANANQIIVGRVKVVSATVGRIMIDTRHAVVSKYGNQSFQPGATATSLKIRANGNLAAGDLVYISSYNATDDAFIATVADADVAGAQAQYVVTGTIATGTTGTVYKTASVAFNVGAAVAGDPVYLSTTGTTTNTLTMTPPTGGDDVVQVVGRVKVTGAVGPVLIDLSSFEPGVATNDYQDASVTNAKLAGLARGFIKRGSAAGIVEDYDANDDAKMLLGNGNDIASVSMSGDATIVNTGAITIADARVEQNDLNPRGVAMHFSDPPFIFLADNSGVATGAAAEVDQLLFPDGLLWLYYTEQVGGPAIPVFTVTAAGINVQQDATDNDDTQFYAPGQVGERQMYTGQTDAFYVKGTFNITTVAGVDPVCIGFKTPQANADIDAIADIASYGGAGEEVVAFCTSGAAVRMATAVNGAGIVNTDSTDTVADGVAFTLEIRVSAAGVVSYLINGAAPTASPAAPVTITADTFFPFFLQAQDAGTSAVYISLFETGIQ